MALIPFHPLPTLAPFRKDFPTFSQITFLDLPYSTCIHCHDRRRSTILPTSNHRFFPPTCVHQTNQDRVSHNFLTTFLISCIPCSGIVMTEGAAQQSHSHLSPWVRDRPLESNLVLAHPPSHQRVSSDHFETSRTWIWQSYLHLSTLFILSLIFPLALCLFRAISSVSSTRFILDAESCIGARSMNSCMSLCCLCFPLLLYHASSPMAWLRRSLLFSPLLLIAHVSLQTEGSLPSDWFCHSTCTS